MKESHLAALRFLALHSGATVSEGDHVGAREVLFLPQTSAKGQREGRHNDANATIHRQKIPKEERITLINPGSAMLVLQAVLPFILFSDFLDRVECDCDCGSTTHYGADDRHQDGKKETIDTSPKPTAAAPAADSTSTCTNPPFSSAHRCGCIYTLIIAGGTNVSHSPSVDYVQQVLLPMLDKTMGIRGVTVEVVKRGWAGSDPVVGEVKVRVRRDTGRGKSAEEIRFGHGQGLKDDGLSTRMKGTSKRPSRIIDRISITILAHTQSDREELATQLLTLLPQVFKQDMCPSRTFEVVSTNRQDRRTDRTTTGNVCITVDPISRRLRSRSRSQQQSAEYLRPSRGSPLRRPRYRYHHSCRPNHHLWLPRSLQSSSTR